MIDPLRSLARYLSASLGQGWRVELAPDEQRGLKRPTIRLESASGRRYAPAGAYFRDCSEAFSVVTFPSPGINAESSMIEARRVAGVLGDAFMGGTDTAGYSRYDGRRKHPLRVPAFSYEGGLYEPAEEADRRGWMKVTAPPAFRPLADPDNSELFLVVGDVQLAWNESIARPEGPPIERVTVGAKP